MNVKKSILLTSAVLLGFAPNIMAKDQAKAERVPGEMIVKLKSDKADLSFFKSLGVKGHTSLDVSFGNYQLIEIFDDKNFDQTLEELNSHPSVEYAEPNFVYRLIEPIVEDSKETEEFISRLLNSDYDPGVERFDELWGLHNTGQGTPSNSPSIEGADIDALRAWAIERGSRQVTIAVIDTGIDYNHEDLKANIWVNEAELNGTPGEDSDGNGFIDDIYGYDFTRNQGSPMDGNGHGTHCAGTIGAIHQNQLGVAGVMADVQMMGIKFLTDAGSGTTANAIRSIDYATQMEVDIMSNSWGGGGRSQALKDSIIRANEKGILFVAAAGNSSANNDVRASYPANYNVENVISVAATTGTDELASFSSYGRESVHIAAPGFHTLSTTPGNNYQVFSGTSMATPHVSGALGLLLSQQGSLSVSEVKERLIATSDPVDALRGKVVNSGRLNAYNLLTDTRPDRNEPSPDEWETVELSEPWESEHPYQDNFEEQRVFEVEGAKFMRLNVERYDIEYRYDYIQIQDGNGIEVDRVTGEGENHSTEFVSGDTLVATFKTDHSINGWGFRITSIEVQY